MVVVVVVVVAAATAAAAVVVRRQQFWAGVSKKSKLPFRGDMDTHTDRDRRLKEITPLFTRMCPYPFFEAMTPGAAPGPRIRRFRGCKYITHKRHNGGRALVFVMSASAEMPGDTSAFVVSSPTTGRGSKSRTTTTMPSAPRAHKQRIQKACLLLDRARDLIVHGPAHHGTNGAAMPTDEHDQDGSFFFNHPKREGYFKA